MTKEITVPAGDKKITQEDLQEKLMFFQLMEKQLETLGQHKSMVDTRLTEIETTKSAIREIDELKPENEALVPLGSGIYTKARITKKKLLTELGASVMKENDSNTAIAFLDERKKDIEHAGRQIDEQIADITKKLQEIGPELQAMSAQSQQG